MILLPLVVSAIATASTPVTSSAYASTFDSFAGHWQTTFGAMTLEQEDDRVRGTYAFDGGRIEGTVTGDTLRFEYAENRASGEGEWTLAPGGRAFEGKWRVKGSEEWRPWAGERIASEETFEGLWETNYGRMRLVCDGGSCSGIYSFGGVSSISGTVEERRFDFTYVESNGVRGVGTFQLAQDGASFEGKWAQGPAGTEPDQRWSGRRVAPVPGRTWLVILEAHWERSLTDREYSFGRMLREYFQRIPSIEVRHRYFDSSVDLSRWCADLAFIPEPVVLYISSHGTPAGLSAHGRTIGADAIVDSLPDASSIRLIHLGGCLMLSGELAGEIQRRMPRAIPISGFTEAVDWGTSALVDFAYMTLVLERGQTPRQAVENMHSMITFSRAPGSEGTRGPGLLPPCGLRVVEPPSRASRPSARTDTDRPPDASNAAPSAPAAEGSLPAPAGGRPAGD